jgi:hypothetical protein
MFPTYEGERNAVRDALQRGGSENTVITNILTAIADYKRQFSYKCTDYYCPSRNGRDLPGFASRQELELHRIRDHKEHGARNVTYSIMGYPRWECQCGFVGQLSYEEKDMQWWDKGFTPKSFREHVEGAANELLKSHRSFC